jgi:hypothetical protein
MAVSIGKRKRGEDDANPGVSSENEDDIRARFQRAFEARFAPLPQPKSSEVETLDEGDVDDEEDDSEDSDDREWGGIEDDGDTVQVFDHQSKSGDAPDVVASERKGFMVIPSNRPTIRKTDQFPVIKAAIIRPKEAASQQISPGDFKRRSNRILKSKARPGSPTAS